MGQELLARVAVVTGAGSGIGRATALALASAGARVAVADLSLPGAMTSAAQIRECGGVAEAVKADVADPASVRSMMDTVHAALGSVAILVNCAGICPTTPLLDLTFEE
jgi:NAD(P)-dependent dehydrogenase (short-subunit alcohol dehydrogenase family)